MQETISRGRAPSLRNFAAQYRDSDPLAVWKATCLFAAALPRATEVYGGSPGVLALIADFRKGLLDNTLMDKARAADKSMEFDDLSYIRKKLQGAMASWSPGKLDRALGDAEDKKLMAEFDLLIAEIQGEELQFVQHIAEKGALEDRVQGEVTAAREEADKIKEKALEAHLVPYYSVEALPDRAGFRPYMQRAGRGFHEAPPKTAEEHGLVLHILSLSAMGVHHSLYLGEMASLLEEQCTAHPKSTAALVVMGNTPVWGKNLKPKQSGWEESVEEARAEAINVFTSNKNLRVRRVLGKYSSQLIYSADRELAVEFLMIISSQESDGVLVSGYARSPVWTRKAIPNDLEALPRSSFQHYTEPFLRTHGNLDAMVELRQWHTGAAFWDAVLTSLHQGALGSDALTCHVREYYLYDPELGKAVMNIRARGSSKQPVYGYAGVTTRDYLHTGAGKNIADHARGALMQNLSFAVDCGYKMLGYTPPARIAESRSPAELLRAPVLKHTAVRDKELPLLQSVHDKWDAVACTKSRWEVLVKKHNDQYNKSGVPFKSRRGPEESLESKEEAKAIIVATPEGAPASKEGLQATLSQVPALGSCKGFSD